MLRTLFQLSRRRLMSTTSAAADNEIIKVLPVERHGESLEVLRRRLVYQSRKRGMLENDLLLSSFAGKYLNSFTQEQLMQYDKLLDEMDWDIFHMVTNKIETPPHLQTGVMELLKEHAKNTERTLMKVPDISVFTSKQ